MPKGIPNGSTPTHSLEVRLRAKAIYHESNREAANRDIAKQLKAEGFDPVPSTGLIAQWKRSRAWLDPVSAPHAKKISEDIRQAVQLHNGKDDLERIDRSALEYELLVQEAAAHIRTKVVGIDIKTPEEFERMVTALNSLLTTQMAVTKSVQDLRNLRISSAFGYGEILPPEKKDAAADEAKAVVGRQEEVLSNF